MYVVSFLDINVLAASKSVDDVIDFLSQINRKEYISSFRENDINGVMLLEADKELLEALTVENPLHQVQILELFKRYLTGEKPKYSNDFLQKFLEDNKLEKHASSLQEHLIDGDIISNVELKLMKAALKEIGMKVIEAHKLVVNFKQCTKREN